MLEEMGAERGSARRGGEEMVTVGSLSVSLSLWEVGLKWRAQERRITVMGMKEVEDKTGGGGGRGFNCHELTFLKTIETDDVHTLKH